VSIYEPHSYVETSLKTPLSISLAAFTGLGWRHIAIPDATLALTDSELLAWVSERVRRHYIDEKGKCSLWGDIVGYEFAEAPHVSVHFDIEGKRVEAKAEESTPGSLSLGIGNKMVEVRKDGTVEIDFTNTEPK
jgi:hypothetical protein